MLQFSNLLKRLKTVVVAIAILALCMGCVEAPVISENPWQTVTLNTDSTFADIAFTDDFQHGWLVGTKETLFETLDGGKSWEQRLIELGEEKESFTGVSFFGQEGWITGRPSILLHTNDGGQNWSRIALSSQLPGAPYGITALAPNTAEMVTDLGAIYKTTDGGKNWKALVEGAVGVARTIERSADGKYVAVSARGNFYSTWEPGDTEWTPHNRNSSRRLQSMGFNGQDQLWLLARGGVVQFSNSTNPDNPEAWSEPITPQYRNSVGLLHIGYRNPEELWAVGGSGSLVVSKDGGKTWFRDEQIESVPTNFYRVVFLDEEKGFILGQQGVILRYDTSTEAA